MTIRKIEKEDLSRCSEILKRAYSFPPYKENFKEKTAECYVLNKYNNGKNSSFVLLNDENKVIAFVFVNISCWSDGSQAILEEIAVEPGFQDKGFGTALLKHVFDYLKSLNIKSIMLWAKKDDRLLNFYKSHGYVLADDFVVMFKNF